MRALGSGVRAVSRERQLISLAGVYESEAFVPYKRIADYSRITAE